MHPSIARRLILLLSFLALLFTLDAAFAADAPPSFLIGLVVLGFAFAWALVQLASRVLDGTHRHAA